MRSRFQFRLSGIFRWTLYVCLAVGAYLAYGRMVGNAQRDAIEKASKAGRLEAEYR
jgi:hypothetical protein